MEQKPRLPPIHVIRVAEGFASVLTSPLCDFCADMYPTWDYGCADFEIPEIPSPWGPGHWASSEDWCVCDECSKLVDAGLLPNLVARVCHSANLMTVDQAGLIIQGFFDHADGTKTPFG